MSAQTALGARLSAAKGADTAEAVAALAARLSDDALRAVEERPARAEASQWEAEG